MQDGPLLYFTKTTLFKKTLKNELSLTIIPLSLS